jgi:hypothetical protein
MPFELPTITPVKLLSINVRTENHGDGLARAIDLKCSVKVPNTKLDEIDQFLRPMLYKAVETEEEKAQQQELPEVEKATPTPLLRSHAVKWPLALNIEYAGYQFDLDRGLGGNSNMVVGEVNLNKVSVTGMEGGTVEIGFRLQMSDVGDDVIGKLSSYIKTEMHIALSAPKMKQEAIDGTQGHPGAVAAAAADAAKKKDEPARTGHEAGDTLAANEKAGKNKPASEVPKPPRKKRASSVNKPSLKAPVDEADVAY